LTELCVDASVAIKLVLGGERLRLHARQLYLDAATASAVLIAPPLFEAEVDSVIRSRVFAGRLNDNEAALAFEGIDRLAIQIESPFGVRQRAREISTLFRQERVYDSTYAALAELRCCEFWTADRTFHNAVSGKLTFVRFLADYPLP
jgi:predicted nucleic acid-binding protein